jgi:hypothetical protein
MVRAVSGMYEAFLVRERDCAILYVRYGRSMGRRLLVMALGISYAGMTYRMGGVNEGVYRTYRYDTRHTVDVPLPATG